MMPSLTTAEPDTGPQTSAALRLKRGRFPALDGVRAIAALGVVAFHVDGYGVFRAGTVNRLLNHLNGGVALFFLLSGFLLYRPFVVARLEDRSVAIRTYFVRRIARIVPAYWFALLVLALWPGLPGFFSGSWLSSVAFVQIYRFSWYSHSGLPVAWSLCTEITFYLALPVYAIALQRSRRLVRQNWAFYVEVAMLAAIAVASMALHMILSRRPALAGWGVSLPSTAYLFAAGMLLALCSVNPNRWLSRGLSAIGRHRAVCWGAALGLFVLLSFESIPILGYRGTFLGPTHPLFLPIAFLMLLPLTLAPRAESRLERFLTNRVIATLGLISYGIYLWHYPLIPQLGKLLGAHAGGLPVLLATVFASALLAGISYVFIERPVLVGARRYSARRKIKPPTQVVDPAAAGLETR